MDEKENTKSKIVTRLRSDYAFRTFVFSSFSFLVTAAFTAYNVFLAIAYQAVWNVGIAVYYALLLLIRAYVIFSERKLHKAGLAEEQKEHRRVRMYFIQSLSLLVIDLALIAPITLMVLQQRPCNYTLIPAIAMAAYTTYKMTFSIRNYVKTRKERHLSVKMLRNVNFMDAFVSVLSLQYTLIMVCSKNVEDMLALCATSTFAIWAFLIVISVLTLVNAVKIKKDHRRAE